MQSGDVGGGNHKGERLLRVQSREDVIAEGGQFAGSEFIGRASHQIQMGQPFPLRLPDSLGAMLRGAN